MFDRCVCFGLLFTSDDELDRTFILPYGTVFPASPHLGEGDRFSRSPLQQMYVRVLQNVLCRERICISSFADASQVLIPMDGIFNVQMKNKHSASRKHPMDGILRALWRRYHPMDGKMKTTSSAFTDQSRLCHRKHCSLQHHPCFRALINLQPRIRRPRCSSARATGTPVASTADSKSNAPLSALFWPFRELLCSLFRNTLPLPARFWPSGDFLSQITLARSFLRETTVPSLFGRIQHVSTSKRPSSQPSHFLQRFIFVRSLQSSPNIVCYGSVLFSVSV